MYFDGRAADCFRLIYDDGWEVRFKNNGRGLYEFTDLSIKRLMDQYHKLNPLLSICKQSLVMKKLFSKKRSRERSMQ